MTDQPLSPRVRFRNLLEEQRVKYPDMGVGELADYVASMLPDEDRQLVEEFLAMEARTLLAFEIRSIESRPRASIFSAIALHRRDAPSIAELSETRQNNLYKRLEGWKEYVPSRKRTKKLLEMTRPELRESANYDLMHAFTRGYKGLLKQALADGLEDDTTTVGDAFDDEQIIDLTERMKGKMTRGNFRLKVQPMDALPGSDSIPGQTDGRKPPQSRGR